MVDIYSPIVQIFAIILLIAAVVVAWLIFGTTSAETGSSLASEIYDSISGFFT